MPFKNNTKGKQQNYNFYEIFKLNPVQQNNNSIDFINF